MLKKILIIDDEPNILITLKDRLEFEGYEVITAIDGTSGLKQADEGIPDLIILDTMLPDMDGHQVCRTIKTVKKLNIPVIMVTSKIDALDAVRARKSGTDDFTVKTADYGVLLDAVKRHI